MSKKKKDSFIKKMIYLPIAIGKSIYNLGYDRIDDSEPLKKKIKGKKAPAHFKEMEVIKSVKGDYNEFHKRLMDRSLIVTITGKRGSGKSVLGFKLLENIHAKTKRPCFVLGVGQGRIPDWIDEIDDMEEANNGGVVLVDEGAISFGSRSSMSKANKGLASQMAIARHKDLTMLFISQNTGMIDKNVLNLSDTLLVKEGSLLQTEMERSFMKSLYKKVNLHLRKVDKKERISCVFVVDADFEGLIKVPLPSFWSENISKSHR